MEIRGNIQTVFRFIPETYQLKKGISFPAVEECLIEFEAVVKRNEDISPSNPEGKLWEGLAHIHIRL